MLTETEARELLQRAASTIDVRPGEPIVAPPRRRWVAPVVAAAAVLAAVVAGLLVVQHHDGASPAHPVPTPTPVVPSPNGRIPSVFAYDADSAERLLRSLGLKVNREDVPSCDAPDRAVGTVPLAGVPYRPGSQVTLRISSADPAAACKFEDTLAWKVLDFANGRGPDPGITTTSRFLLNGETTTPQRGLAVLAALTRHYDNPYLAAGTGVEGGICTPLPKDLADRKQYWFTIDEPSDSLRFGCPSARVFTTADGTIDAVVVEVWPPGLLPSLDRDQLHEPPVPQVHDPYGAGLVQQLYFFARRIRNTPFPGHDTVRFFNNATLWNSLTGSQVDDRDNYSVCSGLGPSECPGSYLDAFNAFKIGFGVTSERPACIPAERTVSERRGGGSMTMYMTTAEPSGGACAGAVTVQIRYDSADRLTAVNVISNVVTREHLLRERANAFLRFALGSTNALNMAYSLRFYENETYVRTLSQGQAMTRSSYRSCGARRCVIDPIRLIRGVGDMAAFRTGVVPACLAPRASTLTEKDTGGTTSVTIRDIDHPCAWGVQLWFNDVGQIVAVDLRTPAS